jgi:hypothetical protein
MGRTVTPFRIVLAEEKKEWNPFRNGIDKKERKNFDEMWDIAKLYISACSNSVGSASPSPYVDSFSSLQRDEKNAAVVI